MYGFFWWDSFKKELDKGYLILFIFLNMDFKLAIRNYLIGYKKKNIQIHGCSIKILMAD